MLSSHLCLLISCDCLVFWILSFNFSFCLIAWYLYFLLSYLSLHFVPHGLWNNSPVCLLRMINFSHKMHVFVSIPASPPLSIHCYIYIHVYCKNIIIYIYMHGTFRKLIFMLRKINSLLIYFINYKTNPNIVLNVFYDIGVII